MPGNDGGSFPHRTEMVKLKAKAVVVDQKISAKSRATLCTLSKAKLKKPIVTCKLGRLFNKDQIVMKLVSKTIPEEFKYIKSIKDVKELNLKDNKNPGSRYPFVCPIIQTPYNGLNTFYALWSCGCVFSKKAFKTIYKKDNRCIVCMQKFKDKHLVNLNLNPDQQKKRRLRILKKQKDKKSKKEKQMFFKEKEEKKEDISVLKKRFPGIDLEKIRAQSKKQMKKQVVPMNLLDKLTAKEGQADTGKDLQKSSIYKSLFHKKHVRKGENFFYNTKMGII